MHSTVVAHFFQYTLCDENNRPPRLTLLRRRLHVLTYSELHALSEPPTQRHILYVASVAYTAWVMLIGRRRELHEYDVCGRA
jgi:hypothetical protein